MFSTKKGGVYLLVTVLLLSVLSLSAFGATGPQDSCDAGELIVYLDDTYNAHASTTTDVKALCFTSLTPSGPPAVSILKAPSAAESRTCRFGNEVLSLSALTNAHVEAPESNLYGNKACFGYVDCRVSANNDPSSAKYEQVV